MLAVKKARKIAVIFQKECVGCGSCIDVCKRCAISVPQGIYAVVDEEKCVGCGACAMECPASVIRITDRYEKEGVAYNEFNRE